MKILVIRFSSIGDILLTFPVLVSLKQKYPNAEIHVLSKSKFLDLFDLLPFKVVRIPLYPTLGSTAVFLRKERFDLVIDLHNNLRTFFLQMLMTRFQWARVNKLNFKKWLYTNFHWDYLPKTHVVDRYLQAAKLPPPPSFELDVSVDLESNIPNENFVVWVLGANFKTKQFPLEKIKETLYLLKMPIVLMGGTLEMSLAAQIQAEFPHVQNFVGKTTLLESAQFLKKAKLVVTNDTGMMHLASLLRKPLICIWGNTTPTLGMSPYQNPNAHSFEVQNLPCRPCSKIGFNACPKGHFSCMLQQNTTLISAKINALFSE